MNNPKTSTVPSPYRERVAWREPDWCAEAGIGRSTMWKEIKSGRLRVRKCGRATLIVTSPREWIEKLPEKAA